MSRSIAIWYALGEKIWSIKLPILEIKNLFCERDDRVLFENLSFSLKSGEIIQVEGQNGSGKTTLLRILCGLNQNDEGDILWQNKAIDEVRE